MFKHTKRSYILTILLGLVSGLIGGGLGLGVTTIALPGFIMLNLVPDVKTAIGTTLVSSPASWPAVFRYYQSGKVDFVLGFIYVFCYVSAAYLGASLTMDVNLKTLNFVIGIVHILIGIYFLHRSFGVKS